MQETPFWYSCLGNPMDRGTWWSTAHGVKKKDIVTKQQFLQLVSEVWLNLQTLLFVSLGIYQGNVGRMAEKLWDRLFG